jgi:hypothetical protein
MAVVTVVRSLVGRPVELPGDVTIRPWHYVELVGALSPEMRRVLYSESTNGVVQLGRVVDGSPLPRCDLGPVN